MNQLCVDYRSLGSRKILVADDVEMNQFLARKIMESWGFQVAVVDNGKRAVEQLRLEPFDLVLMDIQMPEMDGVEATRLIRTLEDPTKASTPIVALTANLIKGDSERYLKAGMNDFLAKPIEEHKLFSVISKNLGYSSFTEEIVVVQKPVSEKLYDLHLVKAISGGDESFIHSMLMLFLETVPATLEELQDACAKQDWELTGKLAHKLKSTIDSMNIAALKDVIRRIEADGKTGEAEEIISNVQQVKQVLAATIAQVKQDYAISA